MSADEPYVFSAAEMEVTIGSGGIVAGQSVAVDTDGRAIPAPVTLSFTVTDPYVYATLTEWVVW